MKNATAGTVKWVLIMKETYRYEKNIDLNFLFKFFHLRPYLSKLWKIQNHFLNQLAGRQVGRQAGRQAGR